MDNELLRSMISEIEKEIDTINILRNEMKEITSIDPIIFRRAMGSILHDFYTCCERIFKRIAFDVNGGFDESEKWYKALLFKMTVPIKDIRLAVISEDMAAELDEYLSFRHVFRNIYGFELRSERLVHLSKKFDKAAEIFIQEIKGFVIFLEKELRKLEEHL